MLAVGGAFLAGLLLGTVTGLLPGLHPNTLIVLTLPLYFATNVAALPFIAFVTGMSIVHTFVSFIPSLLLGAPDGDTALAVTPGHRLLHDGRAHAAIRRTVHGGIIAAAIALASLPVLVHIIPPLYSMLRPHLHIVLTAVMAGIIIQDDRPLRAAGIVALAAALGILVLNSPAANTQYILFPTFAGLFGLSLITTALRHHTDPPVQQPAAPLPLRTTAKGGAVGATAGLIAGFLPGLGASQSAFLVQRVTALSRHDFLVALGGITTADLFFSLAALAVIGNPRSGAAVAIEQVLPRMTTYHFLLVAGLGAVAVGIGAGVTRLLAPRAVRAATAVDYRHLLRGVAILLAAGTVLLTGWFGLLVLGTATALGVTAHRWQVRKSYCMVVLIAPTVLFYAGISVPL